MENTRMDREGFAMVTTLLIVLVLGILAVGVVWIASSEKKTSFAEGVHVASVFAADAGGEAAINFIRVSDAPPRTLNAEDLVRSQPTTTLEGNNEYSYSATFDDMYYRPGWDPKQFADFQYEIDSRGEAGQKGNSAVDLVVRRLYKTGY